MKCYDCMTDFVPRSGSLPINDDRVGWFEVHNIDYMECPCCRDYLFPPGVSQKVQDARKAKQDSLLLQQPVRDFISIREATGILNITRQAFHKNHRIKNGFIYCVKIGDRWFYHKKSVELFRDTGDGRFPLKIQPSSLVWVSFSKEKLMVEREKTSCQKVEISPPFYPDQSRFYYHNSNIPIC